MNARDLPPGQRKFVLDREVEEGDVLVERGPRIGTRDWVVVFVEKARKYWHVAVRRSCVDEARALRDEGATVWILR